MRRPSPNRFTRRPSSNVYSSTYSRNLRFFTLKTARDLLAEAGFCIEKFDVTPGAGAWAPYHYTIGKLLRVLSLDERFDYWLESFRYMRAMGELGCLLGRQQQALATLRDATTAASRNEGAEAALAVLRPATDQSPT